MPLVTSLTQFVTYTGTTLDLRQAPFLAQVVSVSRVNDNGLGYITFLAANSAFAPFFLLENSKTYIVVSSSLGYTIPDGILKVGIPNLDMGLSDLIASKASIANVQQLVVQTVAASGGSVTQTPWTPSNLGMRLQLWLDGLDASTLMQDGQGQLAGWIDKSPLAATWTTRTGWVMPTPQGVRVQAGALTGPLLAGLQDFLLALVLLPNAVGPAGEQAFSTSSPFFGVGIARQADGHWRSSVLETTQDFPTAEPASPVLLCFSRANGVLRTSVSGATSLRLPTSDGRATYGTDLSAIGGVTGAGLLTDTVVGSVVMVQSPTIVDIRYVEGYLAHHHNLPLPPLHPYYAAAPLYPEIPVIDPIPSVAPLFMLS